MNNNILAPRTILQGRSYRYRIEKVLGQGTFGITYLATTRVKAAGGLGELETTMKVAIKEFFMKDINGREGSSVSGGSKDGLFEHYKKKFAIEARNLSHARHPHIVNVLESFEANNTCYYAMEYCGGGSVENLIKMRGGIKEEDSKKYLQQIGDALTFMHNNRMLHLDLKPSNIMLRANGDVALIDFGLAKQYTPDGRPESSTTIGGGTPGYAPLEQIHYRAGKDFPVTMDVYALGGTIYKMLTGERPVEASILLNDGFPEEALRSRGISEKVISCLAKAMAPTKKLRYQTVEEFVSDYIKEEKVIEEDKNALTPTEEEYIEDLEIEVIELGEKPASSAYNPKPAPKRPKFNKQLILTICLFLLGIVLGLLLTQVVFKRPDTTIPETTEDVILSAPESDSTIVEEYVPSSLLKKPKPKTRKPSKKPATKPVAKQIEETQNEEELITDYMEEEIEEEAIPFQLVEIRPSFQGGDANTFSKWVNQSLVYPEIAKENGVQGRVTLRFTVDRDGTVTKVVVLKGVDPSLDKEAVRVVSSSPPWSPGKQRDKTVPVTYTFPINFQLN